ncbi:poly(A)-specific ribonuclease [Dinochytrium kinnereticum]|nr:poly(A)-specific ribonuclease [Dinochytrium kinnereticum]
MLYSSELLKLLKKIFEEPILKSKEQNASKEAVELGIEIEEDAGQLVDELELKGFMQKIMILNESQSSKLKLLEQLLKTIKTSSDEKVVIVSNWTQTLDLVEELMKKYEWAFSRLDGKTNVKSRQAGGEGISLIGASRLILFDINWNPAVCKQAQARIWREGQKKEVKIYRFLANASIEEKIFQRQLFKNTIGEGVLNDEGKHEQFEFKDLRDLFTPNSEGESSFISSINTMPDWDLVEKGELDATGMSFQEVVRATLGGAAMGRHRKCIVRRAKELRLTTILIRGGSSVKPHRGPVRQILSDEVGVFSIGGNNVRHTSRRGLYKWDYKYALRSIKDEFLTSNLRIDASREMHCMTFTNSKSELLVAGQQRSMTLLNIIRGVAIKEMESEYDVVLMRRSRLLCCGTTCGKVILKDPKSYRVEHTIEAHSGTISDMDISGNTLITCGFSVRWVLGYLDHLILRSKKRGDQMMIEPMIKLYDIRTMRSLPPIPFPAGPYFLKFHPTLSSTVFTSSQTGQLQICDIESPSTNVQFYQVDIPTYMTSADVSGTGEIIAFGSSIGSVSQWVEKDSAKVNAYSRNTEFPDSVITPMNLEPNDLNPLSTVGLPYFDRPLLSVWPTYMLSSTGKPAPRIPPDILSQVKLIDFVGYAQNPGTFRRNQAVTNSQRPYKAVDEPKFRSEQERESLNSRMRSLSGNDYQDTSQQADSTDFGSIQGLTFGSNSVPKFYRPVQIKYSKFGIEDFDFGFYNKTVYGGLETDISNSYCNAILQTLFFCQPISKLAKFHIKTDCPKEFCLCCELGFLFRMLEDSQGANCQATNFLRAFANIPQASALGLFDTDSFNSRASYATLIQSFNRFILEQMHQELGVEKSSVSLRKDLSPEDAVTSLMQQVIGLRLQNVNRCQCQHEILREVLPFVVDLTYTKATVPGKTSSSPRREVRFCSILHQSINRDAYSKSWCTNCNRHQFTTHHKFLMAPPNILSINVNMQAEDSSTYFGDSGKSWIPTRLAIHVEGDELFIEDVSAEGSDLELDRKDCTIYELQSSISEIRLEHDKQHLVAFVKPTDSDKWHIFNDFLVEPIPNAEVTFCTRWKIPAILTYVRVDLNDVLDMEPLSKERIQPEILTNTVLLNRRKELLIQFTPLVAAEIPTEPGFLCAIDAEFVALNKEELEIRSDGTRSILKPSRLGLARVSVIRGSEPGEGTPFIDDYINSSEPIVDYLTEYSGIKAGDLDPLVSTRPLVPLKTAYKKLRLLVDLGCVFVGHGLKKDFRIINILIPPAQVIDTVDIFWIKERQRKLSLRFLSWSLLRNDIQKDTHDSVEDARTAMLLYKKYVEFKQQGMFEDVLERLYEEGRTYNFRPPTTRPHG